MIKTAFAQLRFTTSIVFGLPFAQWSLDHLIDAIQETQREFGPAGKLTAEMLAGPELGAEEFQELSMRRFRKQAARAARQTPYYQRVFGELKIDPAQLTYADIARIPLTRKEDLRADPDAFLASSSRPTFRTTTTGTTGKPTSIYFSTREMNTYIALNAISLSLQGEINASDIVQISTSARATLGNTCTAYACQRIGAVWYLTGVVEPAQLLSLLAEKHHIPGKKSQVSFLMTYPSLLGRLVEYGLANGYRPADFGLEQVSIGGEIVSQGLKRRCRELFGEVCYSEGYGMTEIWPFGGTLCDQGHLHFEPTQGLVEVIDPETGLPTAAGQVGTIVATPFPPYRETTLLLRYQTEDLARKLDGPFTCNRRRFPATSDLLGKLRLAVRHAGGWTTPRDILEALEDIQEVPLPARCGFWAVPEGVAVEVVTRSDTAQARRKVAEALEKQHIPVRELRLLSDPSQLQHPFPHRGDLRELSFGAVVSEVQPVDRK